MISIKIKIEIDHFLITSSTFLYQLKDHNRKLNYSLEMYGLQELENFTILNVDLINNLHIIFPKFMSLLKAIFFINRFQIYKSLFEIKGEFCVYSQNFWANIIVPSSIKSDFERLDPIGKSINYIIIHTSLTSTNALPDQLIVSSCKH